MAVILKKMVRTLRSTRLKLSGLGLREGKLGKFAWANGNGQTLRSAGLYRHAASGVAGAQGLHDL